MSKIAFIDLDGVVANSDLRFAQAEQTANAKYQQEVYSSAWTDLYWRTVFDPTNVQMDTPIEGAYDALNKIEENYEVHFLTSHPEPMRRATQAWLKQHRLMGLARDLIMKPVSMQYTKTVVWKVGTIHMLASMYGASEVLVIDDEQMNIDALAGYQTPYLLRTYKSLAMQDETPDIDDDHPF
jgi:hypothetical protein